MEITIKVPMDKIRKLVSEILENLPEAMCCGAMICTHWNYDKDLFTIKEDVDDDGTFSKTHRLTLPKAVKAFETLACKWVLHATYTYDQVMDSGYWDSPMIDSLVQVAVLGEDRYG